MKYIHREITAYRWFFYIKFPRMASIIPKHFNGVFNKLYRFCGGRSAKNQLSAALVFEDASMAESAIHGVYYQMRTSGLISGDGLNVSMGLYTDELDYYRFGLGEALENYKNHTVQSNDPVIAGLWNSAYTQIYTVNAIIAGVASSVSLTLEDKNQFKGRSLVCKILSAPIARRALFGGIPYITGTRLYSQ